MNTCNPIYFMHIAKTAGSYVNKMFVDALGNDACILHAEHVLRHKSHEKGVVTRAIEEDGVRFFSGHIYYKDWENGFADEGLDFCRITTVREPISHLASHIQWLDHYNLPENKQEYQNLSMPLRELVEQISQVDFDSFGDLDAFMNGLSGVGVQMLDNCQSRYFLCGHSSDIHRSDAIDLSSAGKLSESLKMFDAVFTMGQIDTAIPMINSMTGVNLKSLGKKVNVAKSQRVIDINNKVVRSILSKRCLVDQSLWRMVSSRKY